MDNVEKTEAPKLVSIPDMKDIGIEQVLYALSDTSRLEIVRMIVRAGGELPCGSFHGALGITRPTVSHHVGILRSHGILSTRIEGTQKINAVRMIELERRFPGLLRSILNSP